MTRQFIAVAAAAVMAAVLLPARVDAQQPAYYDGATNDSYTSYDLAADATYATDPAAVGGSGCCDASCCGQSRCDASCCDACCYDCCRVPCFTFQAGWVFLKRHNTSDPAIFVDPNTGDVFLSTDDLDQDYASGFELAAAKRIAPCWELEARYLNVDSMRATGGIRLADTALNQGLATSPFTFFGSAADDYQVIYDTDLTSFEVNLKCLECDCLKLYGGFRWIRLDESLTTDGPFDFFELLFQSRNEMYGFQLGADAVLLCRERFQVDGFAKAGVYSNESAASFTDGNVVTNDVVGEDSNTAFAAQLGVRAAWHLDCHWSLGAGYQVFWLDGVNLAADQIGATTAVNNTPISFTQIDTSTLLLHGGMVYVEYRQ